MFLKNKNIILKIRRSKVTVYAALRNVESFLFKDVSTFLEKTIIEIAIFDKHVSP